MKREDKSRRFPPQETIDYILEFLMDGAPAWRSVFYGRAEDAPPDSTVVIVPSEFFPGSDSAGKQRLPGNELCCLNNAERTPILFGTSDVRQTDGKTVLYADLVASSFFLLSRYEEVVKKNERDQFGRFHASFSFLSKDGLIFRPIVDEYGRYLQEMAGVMKRSDQKKGFRTIYLTHDNDSPFRFSTVKDIVIQVVKNLLPQYRTIKHLMLALKDYHRDPNYTFPKIIAYDRELREAMAPVPVESIYFLITARATYKNGYCDIDSPRYREVLKELEASGASFGVHISHDGGIEPEKIQAEVERFPFPGGKKLYSRHHYLRWREPEHIEQMEKAGITDDFTLSFADCIGFRVGTCRPYRFIHPVSGTLTGITIHPLEIMECTLDRKNYMGLGYEQALQICKEVIDKVYEYNGELNILFHNSSFAEDGPYYERLYGELIEYIVMFAK